MDEAMQRKQVQDFLSLYNRLSQRCFTSCCNSFTDRKLSNHEKGCIDICVNKFFQASQRIGTRFAEAQMMNAEAAGGGAPGAMGGIPGL